MADPVVLAVDIGGTKLAAALVDPDGTVVHHDTVPTPQVPDATDGGATVWAALAGLLTATAATAEDLGRPLLGVGMGAAGPVDLVAGTLSPVNMHSWRRFALLDHVRALLPGLPVLFAGDGTCAAIGEHWRGAGRGHDDMLGMVVSTGVGGGLVLGGRAVHGPSGNAGHVGHAVVEPDGPPCPCGSRGCLEALASGPQLLRWAVAQGWRAPGDAAPSVPLLADAARAGDDLAVAAFARSGRAVGVAVVSAAATCDIRLAVVGGGVANVGDLLFAPARAAIQAYAHLPFLDGLELTRAVLPNAGLVGAAALVVEPGRYGPPAQVRRAL